ncbi:MFS transporter [Paenibacillus oenotherae]|uniref:MFS transporter n=1 Tax=Paenibacillus oenotherae TaxID=1435645 RepID=A0ABS7D3Z0_9BACL|nr:MFS transporter [Paenibacillus oenotherae]MBW7474603.1 MFS transporter [Paenibacillus oenotherae]
MNHKAIRGWLMYDWANSAYVTTILAVVMPIYYVSVAGIHLSEETAAYYWGFTQSIATFSVAILSPIMGAIADYTSSKLKFLTFFAVLGALASAGMAFTGEGDWLLASILVIVGTIGFSTGNTFYDGLLVDLAPPEKRDALSMRGFAFGYLGGGLLLALNVAMIEGWKMFGFPDKTIATQAAFLTVGIWWLVFSIPIMRHVKERTVPRSGTGLGDTIKNGFSRIGHTIKTLKRYPELLKYMVSFWFYNDGINTVIVMATVYGKGIGIGTKDLIIALLITQFIAYPSTLLFVRLASRLGVKKSLYGSLSLYVVIVILGYFMADASHFYALAVMVGLVQGGSQAISRSIYANLVPPSRTAEFFGFLSLSSKFSSVAGPLIFSLTGALTGSIRLGILSLIAFFIIGIIMLMFVNLEKGRVQALAGESES